MLHLPEIVHKNYIKGQGKGGDKKGNRRSRVPEYDGRRFGIVGGGLEFGNFDNVGGGVHPVQSEDQEKRNREAFERWKRMRGFGAGWMEESLRVEEGVVDEEGVRVRGMKRERRETFDAWKRGTVPSVKAEEGLGDRRGSIEKDKDFEVGRRADHRLGSEVVGDVGLSFIRKPEEEEISGKYEEVEGVRKQKQVVDVDAPMDPGPSI
jgi:hypothetical protein